MGRPLRIEYPGAMYHVMAHGAGKMRLYTRPEHFKEFVKIIDQVKIKYKFKFHAFVLMRNHYHMLIETANPNLHKGMLRINSGFAFIVNRSHKRKGPVFSHRYKAILVEKEEYYENLIYYIYQNPIKAGIVKKAEEYPASSLYLINKNQNKFKNLLFLNLQEEIFGSKNWITDMTRLINERIIQQPEQYEASTFLGSKKWIKKIKEKYIKKKLSGEIEKRKILTGKSIDEKLINEEFVDENESRIKTVKIYFYDKYSEITQKELAERLNINNRIAVAVRLKRFKEEIKNNKKLRERIEKIENKF